MSAEPEITATLERFARWLAEFSPYYAELRTDVVVHEDAPATLRAFWEVVGWAPGIGFGGRHEGTRPERELTRALAERAFRRWGNDPELVASRGLASGSAKAFWAELPARPWVLHVRPTSTGGRRGGGVRYVDEEAGDDPPLMVWDTDTPPYRPQRSAPTTVASLMRVSMRWQGWGRTVDAKLPPPSVPGPFAPMLPGFWELAPGVWGEVGPASDGDAERESERASARLLYRSTADYVRYLQSLPESERQWHRLPNKQFLGVFTLSDLKVLHPERLANQGGGITLGSDGETFVGWVEDMPLVVERHGADRPGGFVWVERADQTRFRALMKREKLKSYDTQPAARNWALEPNDEDRALARRLRSEVAAGAAPGAAVRKKRGTAPSRVVVSPEELERVRAAAGTLRELLLAAHPYLELAPLGDALDEDDPPLVRAFWEVLGWEDDLREAVGYPDRASSLRELGAALEDYRASGTPLAKGGLPKRFRLVHIDEQGGGVALTNETEPVADPPIVFASTDTGTVALEHPSYLGWAAERLARHALRGRVDASTFARFLESTKLLAPAARAALAAIAPPTRD